MVGLKVVLGIGLAVIWVSAARGDTAHSQVIALSGKGQDYEAVELYERDLAGQEVPVEVLRAIAGSYWRLRRFDTARALYRQVMQQQPGLAGLAGVEAPSPDTATDVGETPAEPEKGMRAPEVVPEDADEVGSPVRAARTAAFQAELDGLRTAYLALEEDRERQRQSVEARIMELMVRTEESIQEMDELQNELEEARKQRTAAEQAKSELSDEWMAEQVRVKAEIADLEKSLEATQAAKQAIEDETAARVESLEAQLVSVRQAKAESEQAAAAKVSELEESLVVVRSNLESLTQGAKAREEALQQRLEATSEREAVLTERLTAAREAVVAEREEARAQVSKLEERAQDLAHQLDTERIAARTRREEYLEAEGRLQLALAEQKAQVVSLQAEVAQARDEAMQVGQQRAQLEETLVAERAAYAAAEQETLAIQGNLESRLAEEEDRVNRLASELKVLQEQAQLLEEQAHERFAELEKERDEGMTAFRQAHAAMEEMESHMAAREAQWQEERAQRELAQHELQETLQAERNRFADTLAEMRQRESELERALGAQQASSEKAMADAAAQLEGLEQALAERDAKVAELLEELSESSLQLALQEIALMEEDFARMEAQRVEEQRHLQERIAELERVYIEEESVRTALESSLVSERERRETLEGEAEERDAALAHAHAQLAEATAALNRQYDALRKQLEGGGIAVRVTEDDAQPEGLVPLIGRIEAAAESATLEVMELRTQFDAERQALSRALASLQAERDNLAAELESVVAQAAREQAAQRKEHEARLASLVADQAQQQEALRAEVARMERALTGAQALAAGLQSDMETQREEQLRVLRITRESAEELNQRIAALEAGVPASSPAFPAANGKEPAPADDSLLRAIEAALEAGERQQAIDLYEARDQERPVSRAVLMRMGNAYRALARYQDAYALFSELLARDPNSLYAEQKVVMTLFDMGEYDKALDRLTGYEQPASEVIEEK